MGRTTLRIDDELLRRLRGRAADEGRSLQDVTNETLRRGLEARPSPSDYRLELDGWEARLRESSGRPPAELIRVSAPPGKHGGKKGSDLTLCTSGSMEVLCNAVMLYA